MLLKHLQYLTALARERHFARAASACGVTQPTLSAGIKHLEEQLGLLVVQRGQRFEGLTPAGERVLAWAQRITADAESLEQEASRLRQVLQGRLRIGVVPTALPAIPILASPLAQKYPGVGLTVIADPSVDIQAGLDQFRFEAGITYLDNEPLSRVRSIPLYREHYLLINSVFTLGALVRSGYWSSVLPHGFLPLLSGVEEVAILPLEGPAAAHTVGVVVSDRDPLQPTATALLDVLVGLDWSSV